MYQYRSRRRLRSKVTICKGHDRQPAAIFAQGSLLAARVTAAWDRQSQKSVRWVRKPPLEAIRADHLDISQIGSTCSNSLSVGGRTIETDNAACLPLHPLGNSVLSQRHGPLSDGAWKRLDLLRLLKGLVERQTGGTPVDVLITD